MIPKVLILQNGERIISGVAELTDNETGKGIGLVFRCPYILSMSPSGELDGSGNPSEFKVNFEKWFAYSSEIEFKVPYSFVMAIADPEPGILEIYLNKFGALLAYDQNNEVGGNQDGAVDNVEESGVSDSGD